MVIQENNRYLQLCNYYQLLYQDLNQIENEYKIAHQQKVLRKYNRILISKSNYHLLIENNHSLNIYYRHILNHYFEFRPSLH